MQQTDASGAQSMFAAPSQQSAKVAQGSSTRLHTGVAVHALPAGPHASQIDSRALHTPPQHSLVDAHERPTAVHVPPGEHAWFTHVNPAQQSPPFTHGSSRVRHASHFASRALHTTSGAS